MRYVKCYSFLLLPIVAALAVSSCKKTDGIDNNKVVITPYATFYGEQGGVLTVTNDGSAYRDLFLGPDGAPVIAICPSGDSNIVMIKRSAVSGANDMFINVDGGRSHNWNVAHGAAVDPNVKWASMILDVPGDQMYVASTATNGDQVSADHGVTWNTDANWGGLSASVSSFVLLPNGNVYALDRTGTNIYIRPPHSAWSAVNPSTAIPAGNDWYLSHISSTLVAVDYKGTNGIYTSDNGGNTWTATTGIPTNQEILSCGAPLNQVLLAGTDSAGIFRYQNGNFVASNNGLKPFTSVYGITGKQDVYKNGIIKRYVYIATNYGLYRSEDLGMNWVFMKPGNLRSIW